jgi:hypothetical protein
MTKRIEIIPAPEPLEAYVGHFDDLYLGRAISARDFAAPWKACSCPPNDIRP